MFRFQMSEKSFKMNGCSTQIKFSGRKIDVQCFVKRDFFQHKVRATELTNGTGGCRSSHLTATVIALSRNEIRHLAIK